MLMIEKESKKDIQKNLKKKIIYKLYDFCVMGKPFRVSNSLLGGNLIKSVPDQYLRQ